MVDDPKSVALHLAHNTMPTPPHAAVLERATAYHAWLTGTKAPAAAATPAAGASGVAPKPAAAATGATGGKPAAAAAGPKPATPPSGKPAGVKPGPKPGPKATSAKPPSTGNPNDQVKGTNGVHTQKEVRDVLRLIVAQDTVEGLGKQEVFNILDQVGGVQNVGELKPDDYDTTYDLAVAKLQEHGIEVPGATAAEAAPEDFDPTA